MNLHSQTVQAINETYAKSRKQAGAGWLAWRCSGGPRRSLGWVPIKGEGVKYAHGQIRYQGRWLGLWDSYDLSKHKIRYGCLAEDTRGRWYLNAVVAHEPEQLSLEGKPELGIDLGLKQFAGFSDETLDNVVAQNFYRDLEPALATAQRANKLKRVKAIHAKIACRRKDFQHKLSTKLASQYGAIFVGNVNASALAKTPKAKSVLDAGWSAFRTMLQYKCANAGVWFDEVDEAFSTQTCSECAALGGPKGIAGLGIREWSCCECGAIHDRDRNAAKNILAAGHRRLVEGISAL